MLATSVVMVLFEFLSHVSDSRYLKPTILAFLVVLDKPKIVTLGCFATRAKVVGSRDPISYS